MAVLSLILVKVSEMLLIYDVKYIGFFFVIAFFKAFFVHFDPLMADPIRISYMQPKIKVKYDCVINVILTIKHFYCGVNHRCRHLFDLRASLWNYNVHNSTKKRKVAKIKKN